MSKAEGVHLLDAQGNHCRFPMWDDVGTHKSNRLIVCGKPGYPWCPAHEAIVFHRKQRRDEELAIIENRPEKAGVR